MLKLSFIDVTDNDGENPSPWFHLHRLKIIDDLHLR